MNQLLSEQRLREILSGIRKVRICTIGDVCLDYYLYADMRLSLLSRETPHYPLPVVKEVYSPGGGGNVVNNIRALHVKELFPVSLIGNDWRGDLLLRTLKSLRIRTTYILRSDSYVTTCFAKPMRMGISDVVYEDPRLDFENRAPMTAEDEERVLAALDQAAEKADIIAVSDQVRFGVISDRIRARISEWGKKKPVVMDSRERTGYVPHVIAKPNEVEAGLAVGLSPKEAAALNEKGLSEIAGTLRKKSQAPVIVTMGDRGAVWCDENGAAVVPTVKAEPPIDIVGAGDTFLSAFAASYAAGATGPEALSVANLASGVTVKKIGTTGTASPEEILEKYREISAK